MSQHGKREKDAQSIASTATTCSRKAKAAKKCFSFCSFPKFSLNHLLRNIVLPRDMWDEFPEGISYHVTDYFLFQTNMPYDARKHVPSPEEYDMQFEEVWLHTKDKVKLHAYLVKQDAASDLNVPTILAFHGNCGNIGHILDMIQQFYHLLKCNILAVEYRGFGFSEGKPTEKGLYADAQAAFDFLDSRDDLDSTKIILFGHSLGGAVAIDLAARPRYRSRIAGLIVENSFTSVPALAKELFDISILKVVPDFCYKNRFESLRKMRSVSCPTLFLSSAYDEIVPKWMMDELHSKCAASEKHLQRVSASHNDCFEDSLPAIADFLKRIGVDV